MILSGFNLFVLNLTFLVSLSHCFKNIQKQKIRQMSGERLPSPALPSTVFSDSSAVDEGLAILHGSGQSSCGSRSTSSSAEPEPFVLASDGNSAFDRKAQDIFSNLGVIEQKHDAFVKAVSNNKRLREKAEACLKNDDESKTDRFDSRLLSEARRRERNSERRDAFEDIHRNVKDVVFGSGGGESTSSTSSMPRSDFKVPRAVPQRKRKRDNRPARPGFMKNPDGWTRYSLEDVQDVTDSSNRSAAFAFLDDLRIRREKEEAGNGGEAQGAGEDEPTKIIFKAPVGLSKKRSGAEAKRRRIGDDSKSDDADDEDAAADDRPETKEKLADEKSPLGEGFGCAGSKRMMKEYVVGAEPKKSRKRGVDRGEKKPRKEKEIKLSHLDDEDDE